MPPLAIGRRISYRPTRSGAPVGMRSALTAGARAQRTTRRVLAFLRVRTASLLVVAAVGSGCTYDIPGLVTRGGPDAASAADGPTTTHPDDSGVDATGGGDAATGPTVYSDFGDLTKWEVFDTYSLTNGPES